jgi:hypothetical protein
MSEKCPFCNKQYSPDCDFRQGRCPLHPALLDKILDLKIFKTIKGWFNRSND